MFDKILMPVDGSEASDRAVHVAADLASRYGAEVIVLHGCGHEYVYGIDVLPERLEDANALVDRHVRGMKDAGLSARGEVVLAPHGRTARAIPLAVDDENVSLIVMGDTRAIRVEPAVAWKRRPQGSALGPGAGPRGPATRVQLAHEQAGKGGAMKANVGDRLVISGHHVGEHDRDAEILEVRGEVGSPPYLVRWADDGHVSLIHPGPDALVQHLGRTGAKAP